MSEEFSKSLSLAGKVLFLFDRFERSPMWKEALGKFRSKGFNPGGLPENSKMLKLMVKLMGRFNNPQIIDRAMLEMKEAAFKYCKENPEKVYYLLRKAQTVINDLLLTEVGL
jgi:hypothetical protein